MLLSNLYDVAGNIGLAFAILLLWVGSRYYRVALMAGIAFHGLWRLPNPEGNVLEKFISSTGLLMVVSLVLAVIDYADNESRKARGKSLIPRTFLSTPVRDQVAITIAVAVLVLPPLYFLK